METPLTPAAAPPSLAGQFEVASASVAGADHLRAGRGSQDAVVVLQRGPFLVALVADGCGAAPHSEVGARLGVLLLGRALLRRLEAGAIGAGQLLACARDELLEELRRLALGLAGGDEGQPLLAAVRDQLLFTLVGAVVGPEVTHCFALGDGLLCCDGEELRLGPFPDNAPPYLGYRLLEGRLPPGFESGQLELRPLFSRPTAVLGSLALGTDGALELGGLGAPVASLLADDRIFRNPDALRRRLHLLSRGGPGAGPRRLSDDTSLVLLRRRPGASPAACPGGAGGTC